MNSLLIAACVCLASQVAGNQGIEADLIIENAIIHDGTGSPPISGDVAVRGDRIVAVGKFLVSGNPRRIAASGLIAAPGFIDLHNHSDSPITRLETRLNRNYLHQGCTTIVTGNCGGGRLDVGVYLGEIDRNRAGTNVVHLLPHGDVRRRAMGGDKRPPSPAELDRMKQLIDQGMREGAFGMSTGLIYTPSSYADLTELIELSKVVAVHNGIYASHMRNEGQRLLEAIKETLEIGRQAQLPVHISHFKVSGSRAWGLAPDAIRAVVAARESGQRVTADQYPYIASSTSLAAMVVPDEYRSSARLKEALAQPELAAKLRDQIADSLVARNGGKSLFLASYKANPAWQGKDLASLSALTNIPVVDLVLQIQQNGGASCVSFGMNEDEVRLMMQPDFVATASDGGAKVPDETVPHPRSYGTFPRKIGYYAIERKIIPVEQAIRSSSGLPADILGLTDRGYLKVGQFADIVVFDPQSFRDVATYEQPHQYATGVRYLLVNGELAIDNGEITNRLGGRALRRKQ